MKTITSTRELKKFIGVDGRVTESVTLAEDCVLWGLINLTSLDGITLAEGCELWELNNLTSLDGITLAEGCVLYDLINLKSLDGITLAKDCQLWGLTNLTSLDGITLAKGCELYNLTNLTSLDGITLAEGCMLHGLNKDINLSANPSAEEMKIIKQIPVDELDMSKWHCGTSHCLAGWAQVISGRELNDHEALDDGRELLPSLSHLFFAPNEPVKKLLMQLQS